QQPARGYGEDKVWQRRAVWGGGAGEGESRLVRGPLREVGRARDRADRGHDALPTGARLGAVVPDVQVEAGGIEVIEELDQVCWKCGECKPIYDFRMDPEKGWRRLKCMACEAADVPPKVRKGDPWRPTPEDERIIADLYPTKGSAACKLLIPKATI